MRDPNGVVASYVSATTPSLTCAECGCPSPKLRRERCQRCYVAELKRLKESGEWVPPVSRRPTTAYLLDHIEPQPNGCWTFTGAINGRGYGVITRAGHKRLTAHRVAYEHFVGPIPDGEILDHECHNRDAACAGGATCLHRRCVNPEHLKPKSHQQNLRASSHTLAARFGDRTHCEKGHEYTPENTAISQRKGRATTYRRCRTCHRERARATRPLRAKLKPNEANT